MRAVVATTALLLVTGCVFERSTAPQPQKSALSQCYSEGCTRPIFVVDGKRLPESSVDLNPSEIESVEVLRGELALKQFGDDAKHGVVLITTRRAATKSR